MIRELAKRIPGARPIARSLGLVSKPANSSRSFLLELLPKQSVGAEIGVHMGDFSESLLASVSPRELHLIDPWEHQTSETYARAWYGGGARDGQREMDHRFSSVLTRFQVNIRAQQVLVHRGYSSDVLQQFPDGYFDWVYIDGNHLYEYVKGDLAWSLKKVKPGGYITGDDYTANGWWGDGVRRAVDEFAKRSVVELITIQGGQFVFRKGHSGPS